MSDTLPAKSGRPWLPGQSGNPAGRPVGSKNKIIRLQQELEIAVRDNLKAGDILAIVQKMADMAKDGNVKAAKLILDKVLSNPSSGEEKGEGGGTFIFQVKNLTLKHPDAIESIPVIDVTPQEQS